MSASDSGARTNVMLYREDIDRLDEYRDRWFKAENVPHYRVIREAFDRLESGGE